jgi:thiol-disulfide isomerase/thioredoxin
MRRVFVPAFLVIVAFTVLAADSPLPRKLPVGVAAPRLDFRLIDGSLAPSWRSLRGNVVIVDFWASWCAPCAAAIPHLDALQAELTGERVRFYAVTYEPRGKAKAFLAKHPMQSPVGIDDDLATFRAFIAWGIPMTYVIDRNGTVAAVVNPSRLAAANIRDVLAGKLPDVEQHPGWNDPAGAEKYFREQLTKDRQDFPNTR